MSKFEVTRVITVVVEAESAGEAVEKTLVEHQGLVDEVRVRRLPEDA